MVNKGIVYIGDVSGNLGTINASGQLRVEAAVSIPPVSADVSGNTIRFTNDGVNNVVSISGQTVVASVNVAANVSGNIVYLVNDSVNNVTKISGQLVVVSGTVRTLSGSTTNVSGNTVSVSGIVTVNSLPVISISGNAIQISGQTVTVANAVSTGVSGQTIYLVNNGVNNVVQISGQTVVASVTTNISGQVVATSGTTVYLVADSVNNKVRISGEAVKISGQLVNVGIVVDVVDVNLLDANSDTIEIFPNTGDDTSFNTTQPVLLTADANHGYDATSNRWVRLRTTGSGDGFRLIVSISGQPIQGSFAASVSGQPVLISGQTVVASVTTNISGQLVATSGTVQTLSGSVTQVSGQTIRLVDDKINNVVWISGQVVTATVSLGATPTSGDAARVSGQTVYLPNDSINNVVKVSGQFVTVSGSVEITNPGDIICSISGNTVYLISGFNPVQISGQTIRTVDDGVNNVVKISGQTVVASVSLGTTPTSGDAARVSGQVFYTVDDSVNNKVKISGQTIRTVNDGVNNIVQISGQTVVASVTTNISGQHVSVSGVVAANVSGATVSVSGIIRLAIPTAIRTRAELACTALSGGTQLLSGDVRKATVLNAGSAGTVMFIGSTTDPPFSGGGFRLVAGNGLTIETTNFDRIRAFAATSGIMISYIGEQY